MIVMRDLLSSSSSRDFDCRVSSVLNRRVKEFGKRFLFDGLEDTCWNSEQGRPQWVQVHFGASVRLSALRITFQGGFAGKDCWLEVSEDGGKTATRCFDFHPEDNNKPQTFELPEERVGDFFRVVFADSTDFFGRVTVYSLQMLEKN